MRHAGALQLGLQLVGLCCFVLNDAAARDAVSQQLAEGTSHKASNGSSSSRADSQASSHAAAAHTCPAACTAHPCASHSACEPLCCATCSCLWVGLAGMGSRPELIDGVCPYVYSTQPGLNPSCCLSASKSECCQRGLVVAVLDTELVGCSS